MLLSWLVVSLIFMLVPVWIGRQIFSLWFEENPRVYELYTASMGLYACLLSIRGATLAAGWIQQGWTQLSQKMREWAVVVSINIGEYCQNARKLISRNFSGFEGHRGNVTPCRIDPIDVWPSLGSGSPYARSSAPQPIAVVLPVAGLGLGGHVHQDHHCPHLHGPGLVAKKSHRTALSRRPAGSQFGVPHTPISCTCCNLFGSSPGLTLCCGPWGGTRTYIRRRISDFHPKKNLPQLTFVDCCIWTDSVAVETI